MAPKALESLSQRRAHLSSSAGAGTTTTAHALKNLPKPRVSLGVVVVVHKRTEKTPQLQPPDRLLKPKNSARTDFGEYCGQPLAG